jgi:hypothetical protein
MEYKLLGVKFNVINVILCIALGFFICAMLGYNNKKIIETIGKKNDPDSFVNYTDDAPGGDDCVETSN